MQQNSCSILLSGTIPVIPYRAVSWFTLSAGSSFITLIHSLIELTKSFQFAWLASVIARCAAAGLWRQEMVHCLLFHICSAMAMAFTVLEVKLKMGESC